MEGSSLRVRDPLGDVLPPQRDTVSRRLWQPVRDEIRWEGPPGRRRKCTRYDSNKVCQALRRMPAGRGAAKRVAGIPEWDGEVRFQITHRGQSTKEWIAWPPGMLTHEACASLYDMARGAYDPPLGIEMKNDPNDPPAVRLDILKQGSPNAPTIPTTKPWGFR